MTQPFVTLRFGGLRRLTRACLCGITLEINAVRRYMIDPAP